MDIIDQYIKYIEKFERDIEKDYSNRDLLINQTFLAWYVLVEGNLESDELYGPSLKKIVDRNYINLVEYWPNDPLANFLIGWMAGITPWFFNENIDAKKLLKIAYQKEPTNLLFRWALLQELNLSKNEIELLKNSISNTSLNNTFNFDPTNNYFIDVLNIRK